MSKRALSAPAVVAWLAAGLVASAAAVAAWLIAVLVFGSLHYAANRWLLDDAEGSVRGSFWTAALWAVLFGLLTLWWQRRASRRAG